MEEIKLIRQLIDIGSVKKITTVKKKKKRTYVRIQEKSQ